MLVSEFMHKGVITANVNDTVKKVAEVMRKEDIGALPVVEDMKVVGFVTDRDIVMSCIADGFTPDEPISHVMNEEVISILADQGIDEVERLMEENQVSRLVVVDENQKPIGMISLQDISQNLSDEINAEILNHIKQ